MKKITDRTKCCGCNACTNICPKDAITMQENKNGFLYPIINQKNCINCNLCKSVCPILNKKKEDKRIVAYACYNNNLEERINSSSGGIFILIAKEIIRKNGVVFGASFDNNFDVIHSYAENEKDLRKFMGSKYTQSAIGISFKKVKFFLDNGRYVLFSGTPCQIAGLKSYLKKEYDKLYTQDIICHGVPSPKVWRKYLEYQKDINKENIKNISFRNKEQGWPLYRMKISFDTTAYSREASNDLYMKAFLSNLCLRDSCYDCKFKKNNRNSDITLADYWGIEKVHPYFFDENGISLVIINSKKGNKIFDSVKNNMKYIETNIEKAIEYNPSFINSVKMNKNQKKFMKIIDYYDFDKAVNKSIKKNIIINKIKLIVKILIGKN